MKRIKSDRILLPDRVWDGYVYFDQGKICEISRRELPVEEEICAVGDYVSPGFVEIHSHGGGGNRFEGSLEEIVQGCQFHLKHGTTSICPTVSAASFDFMAQAALRVEQAKGDPRIQGSVMGVHLEGPYLSPKQAGAQCPAHITPPKREDYLPFLKAHASAIARWTYAPENDEDQAFVKTLREFGVKASAGHTDAVYSDVLRALKNGCNLITHLYSCTSTVTRDHGFRSLGVIESAYLLDEMFVEIICDGKHLPPELIQLIYKIKGADRIALVTDSLCLAGTEETHGWMQDTEFIIEDGVCKLPDRSAFAGSIATADRLVRVAVKEAGIPLTDAVKMMTQTPAEIMGFENKGSLTVGKDADFVIFDEEICVKKVIARGVNVSLDR